MKISVERCNTGTSIKCFIPKTEITEIYIDFIKDNTKDFRKQKTYKGFLSYSQERLLEKIIYELMIDYKQYSIMHSCGEVGAKSIELKIENVFFEKIDEYQRKALLNILSLAKSFVFNEKYLLEIDTLKDKYDLNKKDLMISIIGTYGYGKTTLIKKIFNFTDDFIFPLVDKGRTSINNCYFRGLIVKDNKINNIDVTKYKFKNIITFKDFKVFFNEIVTMNLYSSFDIYVKARHTDMSSPELLCLKKFIINDKANLDELFGSLDEYDTLDTESFYNVIIAKFEQLYNSLPLSLITQIDIDNIDIPGKYKKELLSDNILINSFTSYISQKIHTTINKIASTTNNPSIIDEAHRNQVSFYLTQDQIGEIDNYYNFFINNASHHKGNLLRLIVDEIYTELDLDSNLLNISDDISSSITSLVLVDTMGAGHNASKSEPNNNLCKHITQHTALLNETDIILLLDNAAHTMDQSTQDQIKALDSYGYKEKVILVYSWYNYLLKKNFSHDSEREEYLINKLNEKLEECFSDNLPKAERLFSLFNANDKERIVFLKGLVPYISTEPEKTTIVPKGRKNKSCYSQDTNSNTSDYELDRLLNALFTNESLCLEELINKIYTVHKSYESLKSSSCTLTTNIKDTSVILDFGKLYNDFSKEYISSQHEEYILYPPEYNTSQALCYNLSIGSTGFSGISRDLFPLDDAVSVLMHRFSNFIDSSLKINITTNDEGTPLDPALNGDFIKDRIKNEFSNGIKQLYILFLITSNQSDWEKLHLDWGDGVKYRRSQKIYSIIQQTFNSSATVTRDTSFKILNDSIQTVINQYANIISN